MTQLLSVVVPCFNEEAVIAQTHAELARELEQICADFDLRYEILFVNDGSADHTLEILHALHASHLEQFPASLGEVVIVSMARNFGHQLALTAGLRQARGDAVVAIDADLQDPPAVIRQMVEKWRAGVDVVYGVRTSREGETYFKKSTARLFYLLVRRLTSVDIPMDTGDFRLMSRRALDAFNQMPERNRFIRGMVPWIGYRQESVGYARAKRFAGTTKYPLTKMLRLAFDGITSFSNVPLRLTYLVGFAVTGVCLLYLAWVVLDRMIFGTPMRGWSSLMVAILFLGSVQLIMVGILGEYIGRIYEETKHRPLFIVDAQASRLPEAASEPTDAPGLTAPRVIASR